MFYILKNVLLKHAPKNIHKPKLSIKHSVSLLSNCFNECQHQHEPRKEVSEI